MNKQNSIPSHVAVIMDGNGRWAEKRNLPRTAGHLQGVSSFEKIANYAGKIGIQYLTVFAFSTENWKRPKLEVNYLFHLLALNLKQKINKLNNNNIRLNFIGDISNLESNLQNIINKSIEYTKNNSGMVLTIAVNYGGKMDLINAINKIHKSNPESITEEMIYKNLMTHNLPDPDLLIRSGGEKRISNFMLWQLAYSEIYFSDIAWPDFDEQEFEKAISFFINSERRFGGATSISKVLEENKNYAH